MSIPFCPGFRSNPLAPPPRGNFPMIGKIFSNGWKILPEFSNGCEKITAVCQRLDKIFLAAARGTGGSRCGRTGFQPVPPRSHPNDQDGRSTSARDYGKHCHFRLFSAFLKPLGQDARAPADHLLPYRVSMATERFPWNSNVGSPPHPIPLLLSLPSEKG